MDYRDLPEGASLNPCAPWNETDAEEEREQGVAICAGWAGDISTPEERHQRLMAVLKPLEAKLGLQPKADILTEHERRSKQTMAEWFAENMGERKS
jgi:hypothetical protein